MLTIRPSRLEGSEPDTPMIKRKKRKGGAMIKDPVVPLSPSLLPQQRLCEVKARPTWPSQRGAMIILVVRGTSRPSTSRQ